MQLQEKGKIKMSRCNAKSLTSCFPANYINDFLKQSCSFLSIALLLCKTKNLAMGSEACHSLESAM